MKGLVLGLVVAVTVGAIFMLIKSSNSNTAVVGSNTSPLTTTKLVVYSLAEVGKHNTSTDCWMAISGNVYNISTYTRIHPGGSIIIQGCGNDATTMFNAERKHLGAKAILNTFKIGKLAG